VCVSLREREGERDRLCVSHGSIRCYLHSGPQEKKNIWSHLRGAEWPIQRPPSRFAFVIPNPWPLPSFSQFNQHFTHAFFKLKCFAQLSLVKFQLCNFLRQNISEKGARKMLMKLTPFGWSCNLKRCQLWRECLAAFLKDANLCDEFYIDSHFSHITSFLQGFFAVLFMIASFVQGFLTFLSLIAC